jgi:hypothetical protein
MDQKREGGQMSEDEEGLKGASPNGQEGNRWQGEGWYKDDTTGKGAHAS